jgi:hypothetical protein
MFPCEFGKVNVIFEYKKVSTSDLFETYCNELNNCIWNYEQKFKIKLNV